MGGAGLVVEDINVNQENADGANIFEQISRACREFRKQISHGKPPRIEKFLSRIPEDGQENLFSNLLEIEINFRRTKGQALTSDEYLKRFPQFSKQVRRAFFEPTMVSIESASTVDGETVSFQCAGVSPANVATVDIPDAGRLGDYELIREIGRGGMGVVYEARHTETDNRVALKTLPTGGRGREVNADKLYRFRKEFRTLSEINHPNLVGMQTFEVDGSQWFFTMDLINGEDFLSFVRPENKLDVDRLRSCLKQLAQGVMALHRQGIIHRDLKPSNVLVSEDGRVSVLDFGLAAEMQKTTDMTQTNSGMFAGTPRYAAPEQILGERTEASDCYALGTMVYEALTGEPPFTSNNPIELLRQKQNDEAPSLGGRDDLPQDLVELTGGLIRREPLERLDSDAIAEQLQLNVETRTGGSMRGLQGSTGSVEEDDADLGEFTEEEVVLIGREEQLAQLEAIKQEFLESRKPQIVWITGLSGEGKSSLAEKFLRPIRHGNEMLVLSGRCYDRESVPFKVIDSMIDPLVRFLRARPDDEVQELLTPDVAALAQLFPLLKRLKAILDQGIRQLAGLDDKQIHSLAFVALKDLLHNIGRRFPIVMFVDDLQWGDADSAEVMFNLLGTADSPAVLLIGSCRRDEVNDSPFLTVWGKAKQGHPNPIPHRQVEVQPLTPEQAIELISLRVGVSRSEIEKQTIELIADTQGNPYFVEQLIEGFDAATGSFRAVSLDEIIATKLQRLPVGAASLLDAIAVAGKSVSLVEASQVCGQEQPAYGTVSHMRSERLLRLVGAGNEQFVDTYHDKIRETLLSVLDEQRKMELHLAFGEWIERQSFKPTTPVLCDDAGTRAVEKIADIHPRSADLAFHFLNADVADKAFRYSLDAGRQAMAAFAFSDALGFLEQAHSLEPQGVGDSDRFALRFLMGRAYSGVGRVDDCIEHLQVATAVAPSATDRAEAYFTLAEARHRKSDYNTAVEDFQRAFAELGEHLPKSTFTKLFGTCRNLVSTHLIPGSFLRLLSRRNKEDLVRVARMYPRYGHMMLQLDLFAVFFSSTRSCAVAKTQNDTNEKCEAYGYYAFLLAGSGVPILSSLMMNVSHRLSKEVSSISLRGALHLHRGTYGYFRGDLERAESELIDAVHLLGKVDDHRLFSAAHFLRHLWSSRGNSSKIEEYARKEFDVAQRSDDEITTAYGSYGLADAWSRRGEFERSMTIAREAVDVLEKWNGVFKCTAYQELGRAQLQASDYEVARKTLAHAVGLVIRIRFFEISVPAFPLLVEAILGSNWIVSPESLSRKDRNSAHRTARIARWTGSVFPNNRPHAFRVSGRLAAAKGKSKKAMNYFDKAIAAGKKIGADYEHARALIDKSMLDYPQAMTDRESGLGLLGSLGCVLPDAEVEYLGIDREAHHSRAAAARERDQGCFGQEKSSQVCLNGAIEAVS